MSPCPCSTRQARFAKKGITILGSQDGTEIYYRSSFGPGLLVAEVDVESSSATEPVAISDIVMRLDTNFDVTADGQRFLVTIPAGPNETPRINVVLNWFEELKERVPTGQ